MPCMLARSGVDQAPSVMTNSIKREMIEWILNKKPSIDFSIEDISYAKLNDTLSHHCKRFKKNVAEAAAKLLLVQSNPILDPHHAWALVIVRALWRAQNLHSIFPLALTQEELGVPP